MGVDTSELDIHISKYMRPIFRTMQCDSVLKPFLNNPTLLMLPHFIGLLLSNRSVLGKDQLALVPMLQIRIV